MKLFLIQPGRFGDIIICLPIARYYANRGYDVYWPVPHECCSLFRNIDYAVPIGNDFEVPRIRELVNHYKAGNDEDMVIDLSFGFHGRLEDWWQQNKSEFDSFVTAKYQLANVPLEQRWTLHWNRNRDNEDALYKQVVSSSEYILVQNSTHIGKLFDITDSGHVVYFRPVDDFNIFDWQKVIEKAGAIHCIDSALSNFVEVLDSVNKTKKYIYLSKRNPGEPYLNSLYRNNWIVR